jgi:hypothetical protein
VQYNALLSNKRCKMNEEIQNVQYIVFINHKAHSYYNARELQIFWLFKMGELLKSNRKSQGIL